MSVGPVTDFLVTMEALYTAIYNQLNSSTLAPKWNILKYGGTNVEGLFRLVPAQKLPAAIIAYDSSKYYDGKQRRNSIFHVLIVVRAPADPFADGLVVTSEYATEAMKLLDWRIISGQAKIEVMSDDAIDLGPSVAAQDVKFIIKDH